MVTPVNINVGGSWYKQLTSPFWDGNFATSRRPGAVSYVGVPMPTDSLPGLNGFPTTIPIMPTLPNGAYFTGSDWHTSAPNTYNPMEIVTPTWVDGANQYYIDPSHPSANDTNNGGRGSPTLPRLTIPGLSFAATGSWTLSAGDEVFIVGDGNVFGAVQDVQNINMIGTAASKIWIIGVSTTSKPLLNFKRFFCLDGNMSHVLIDGVHFGSTNEYRAQFAGISHVTFRNNLYTGEGILSTGSRRFFSMLGTALLPNKFVVIYNNEMRDLGLWNPGVGVQDCHAIQVDQYNRYIWIVKNTAYHLQGDFIQTGNSGFWDMIYEKRSHFTFVAGNTSYENAENAFDVKDSYHNIVSSNYFHDFYANPGEPAANSTAVIMGQDSEGFLSSYTWIINNFIENCGTGIRCSATSDGYRGYSIGNIIKNAEDIGIEASPRSHTHLTTTTQADYLALVNNTLIACGEGFKTTQGGAPNPYELQIVANLTIDCAGTYDIWFEDYPSVIRTYTDNIVYRTVGIENVRLDGSLTINNNTEGTDPILDINYVPQAGSIAIDYVTAEHAAYSLFNSMYGVPIAKDQYDITRPRNSIWDAGALEVA